MYTEVKQQPARIPAIDIIRGIALLGILIINIQTYSLFLLLRPEQVYSLQLDKPDSYGPLQFAIALFIKGEFYPIYSFLFGLGFYMMFRKNELQGLDAAAIYKRRLYILLLIGLIHGLVFWFGDILHKYALLGFSLLYFNKKPVAVIIKWIAGLLLFVIIFQVSKEVFFSQNAAAIAAGRRQMDTVVMEVINAWRHGSFAQVLALQKKGVLLLWLMDIGKGLPSLVEVEILFLAGLAAGKMNLFKNLYDNKIESKLIITVLITIPFAVAIKGLFCFNLMEVEILPAGFLPYEPLIYSLCNFTGSLLLTVVYIPLLFILLKKTSSRFFIWIGNAGKMGLTNYLAQTAICMLLFYGYAGGLSGKVTLFQSVLLAAAIYTVQVLYSNIWLTYYTTGPLEMLWKKLAYRKTYRQTLEHRKDNNELVRHTTLRNPAESNDGIKTI